MPKKKEIEEIKGEDKEDKEDKAEKPKWFVGEIPTQTAPVIVNRDDPEKPLSTELALAEVLNKLEKLEALL